MFTGLIDHTGTVIKREGARVTLTSTFTDLVIGESITVDGICLTVVEAKPNQLSFDISPETDRLTTSSQFKTSRLVNLERALRASDRFGGHYVTGHIDGIGIIKSLTQHNDYLTMHIHTDDKRYLIHKGSIAVNGVSLTINAVQDHVLEVMLIPHTLAITNLHTLAVGDAVNLEFDWMVKVVVTQCIEKGISHHA